MHKRLTFLILLLCTAACGPLEIKPNQEVDYIKIIDVNGKNKSTIFPLVEQWFSETYNSSKSVINFKDPETGVIIGRVITRADVGLGVANNVYYNIKVEVKDEKIRLTGNGFNWVQGGSPIIYQATLKDIHQTFNVLNKSLSEFLNKKILQIIGKLFN
jgi:hypothetical protein